jgi:hypothetical protein
VRCNKAFLNQKEKQPMDNDILKNSDKSKTTISCDDLKRCERRAYQEGRYDGANAVLWRIRMMGYMELVTRLITDKNNN